MNYYNRDRSVAELFVLLSINPEKGRVSINGIHFGHTLTGALIMDLLEQGEIKIDNKRIIPLTRQQGNQGHTLIADRIMKSGKTRRISFWIIRLSNKSRSVFREIINSLEKEKLIRIEHRKILYIFPYNNYWFNDISVRLNLVELLRGILLYGKKPGKQEIMLLSLIEASRAYNSLSRERGESKILRKKNLELLKSDDIGKEISQTINEIKVAITSSITAATIAAHGSH